MTSQSICQCQMVMSGCLLLSARVPAVVMASLQLVSQQHTIYTSQGWCAIFCWAALQRD